MDGVIHEPVAIGQDEELDLHLISAALRALADLIEAGEVDQQLGEFTPDELRHQADLVQENDALGDEMLAALLENALAPGEVLGAPVATGHVTEHLYVCRTCGQLVDMRDLSQVLHHEKLGHQPLLRN